MSLALRNSDLYTKLRSFAIETFGVLANEARDGLIPVYSQLAWQKEEQANGFARRQVNKPEYWLLIHRAITQIKALPTYDLVAEAVRADDVWSKHIDTLVGSASGRSRIELDSLLNGIALQSAREPNGFALSDEFFNNKVERIEDFFCSEIVKFSRTTPLYGISSIERFSITESISIEPLNDVDILELLEAGVISSQFGGMGGDFVHNIPRVALVSRYSLPKIIGEANGVDDIANLNSVTELGIRLSADEAMVLEMLTLLLDVAITPIGSVTKSLDAMDGMRQIQKNGIGGAWALPTKDLTQEVKEKINALWPLVSGSAKIAKNFLGIAIRRYALAMSRPSLDDKLIDLMISAEAIFLRVDQNELTYKLAHRAALLLGTNSSQQKEIFKFINDAYSMRSKVVHGAKSYTKEPRDIEKLSITISRLSELLRESILKMLAIALDPHAPSELIDWKDLMFPEVAISET
ncbi:MAG: hypothetical protein ABIJ01_08110 [Pseudomonadota bacterium]